MRESEQGSNSEWARLCDLYDAAAQEAQAAMQAVQAKVDAGGTPSIEDLVRLENASAARSAIERQMQDFATTRGD